MRGCRSNINGHPTGVIRGSVDIDRQKAEGFLVWRAWALGVVKRGEIAITKVL